VEGEGVLTKVAFVHKAMRAHQSVMLLSAVLKEKLYETNVFIIEGELSVTCREIIDYDPQVVAFSSTTHSQKKDLELARLLKDANEDFHIIMGGPHPTFYPQVIEENEQLDSICVGEGEYALLELVENIENKSKYRSIRNLHIRENGKIYKNGVRDYVKDLDEWPIFDYGLYFDKYSSMAEAPTKMFMAAKGCPFPCSYCFNAKLLDMYKGKGPYVRSKSPDRIIEEIQRVRSEFPLKWVKFDDDTFGMNRSWLLEFAEKYKKLIGLPFLCNLRANMVDEELVKILKDAGVDRIDFGVECGNEKFRKDVLKRNISNEHIIKTGDLLKKYKIRFHTGSIVGFPGETVEQAFETVYLNRRIRPNLAACSVLQPYPGTAIYDYALKHNYLKKEITMDDFGALKTVTVRWKSGGEGVKSPISQENITKLINLSSLFDVAVQHPKLESVIRILIKHKPNRIFNFLSQWGYFKVYFKYASGNKDRLRLVWRFLKPLFPDKH